MDHMEPPPDRVAPIHEGKRMAIGIVAAAMRNDEFGVTALLRDWDQDATIALAMFASMALQQLLGEEKAAEFVRDTALSVSEE